MLGPHVVPPVSEWMVLAVVQLTDSITHIGGSFDASGDDFFANFVTQYLLAQVRHNRSLEDRPITDDRAISPRSRSVAEKRRPVARSRWQLSSGRAICSA